MSPKDKTSGINRDLKRPAMLSNTLLVSRLPSEDAVFPAERKKSFFGNGYTDECKSTQERLSPLVHWRR